MEWFGRSHLPDLLEKVLNIDGEFYVRLGMGNPHHFMGISDQIIELMKHKKMFKFLHIPLQSGDDEVLKSMNRKYTVEEFFSLIDKIRAGVPNITISTDIICGFPGETDEQPS